MVVMFILHQIERNKLKVYNIYDELFNDDKKNVREIYIREKVMEDYLLLKTAESDLEKIERNSLPIGVVKESFITNYIFCGNVKYEGIIVFDNSDLFGEERNVFWKYFRGHLFILVCSEDENILQASNFLEILENVTNEEMVKDYVNNQILCPEKFIVLMDALMPAGQLMFMTINLAEDILKNINM